MGVGRDGIEVTPLSGAEPVRSGNQNWTGPDAGGVSIAARPTSRDFYAQPPTTPNAWDDEFDGGAPDPAARGWLVLKMNLAVPTVMVRDGEADYYTVSNTISPNHYRSSVRNSRLFLQTATGDLVGVYKALPIGDKTVAMGIGHSYKGETNTIVTAEIRNTVAAGDNQPSEVDYRIGMFGANIQEESRVFGGAPTVYQTFGTVEPYREYSALIRALDSTHAYNGSLVSDSGRVMLQGADRTIVQMSSDYGGILTQTATAGRGNWAIIDFMRLYPAGTYYPV